ncbi:MAG: bifunctional diaminohydroxyphosphoribosylaminopyrimidine deaminase/5-amino-6-(5-phosphoribosylamino)uracil reductase RibD [Bacteroidales bacterium]|nr:bifunctional diaminohydroxyphosphoribosylaminopyrimidine deaminase/5-amino-6-(5-phosphoribosylamino)uracil reductase RibD [Bacteroidales bacterium]
MNDDAIHKKYMNRCIELARLGLGSTAPNPMVGAVIVSGNHIIGEGYHHKAGEPHAEVNAIRSVKDKDLLKNSMMYVNLEPCSHTGKTPPCADLIIENRIPVVIIGTRDPHDMVAGKGIERLNRAGVVTKTGICCEQCIELNKRFFTFHSLKRPYIILKWAQSADGFIDVIRHKADPAQPNWISGEISRMLVHKWRTEEQAIMVGTNTALLDNPQLNARHWPGKSPMRIVLDRTLRLPSDLHLFNGRLPTLIINESKDEESESCIYKKVPFNTKLLPSLMTLLHQRDIQSVIVEGGKKLLESFISAGLWDEARIFTGTQNFVRGIRAPEIKGHSKRETVIEKDVLTITLRCSDFHNDLHC